jgi:hypothetical protein
MYEDYSKPIASYYGEATAAVPRSQEELVDTGSDCGLGYGTFIDHGIRQFTSTGSKREYPI